MAGVFNLLYTQEFTSTDTIQITHNSGREYIKVKVVIDSESREELISGVVTDVSDPANKLTVSLVSAQTGIIQLFETDFVTAGELSSTGTHGVVYTIGDQVIGGNKTFTAMVSGINPTEDSHLTTKNYDDTHLRGQPITSTAAANGQIVVWGGSQWELGDHGDLDGLDGDDHLQYVPRNGTRGFTSTVSGINPTLDKHLVTKEYALALLEGGASGVEPIGNIMFGSQFQYEQDLSESQTTSITYVELLSMTVTGTNTTYSGVPAGEYRLGWSFEWRMDKLNNDFKLRIQLDNTTDLYVFQSAPFVAINFFNPNSGFTYCENVSSGVHTIDMDFASSDSKATAIADNVKMEFWRVY